LSGKEPFPLSFYEMLNNYIKEIKMIQPKGPYILGGFCIGGYLSYDITKIFELQGEKVKALLELDQEPFVYKDLYTGVRIFETVLRTVELWRKITRRNKIYTIEKMRKLFEKKNEISKERQMEIIKNRESIRKYFGEELMPGSNYCFFGMRIKTPTLVIKAEENNNTLFETESWENMAKKLEFYEIPGNHDNILLPPYVDKVGEIVLDYLDRMD